MHYRIVLFIIFQYSNLGYSEPLKDYSLQSINDFGLRLLNKVVRLNKGNVAISPPAIWSLLALLSTGAGSATLMELLQGLGLPETIPSVSYMHRVVDDALTTSNGDIIFKRKSVILANSDLKLHKQFSDYGASLKVDMFPIDTSNVNHSDNVKNISNLISRATFGNIEKAVTLPMLENINLFLLDALYFKAKWTNRFYFLQTRKANFFNHMGETIGTVRMMNHKAINALYYDDNLGAKILKMSYGKKGRFSMIILQPFKKIPLTTLLKKLTKFSYREWSKNLQNNGSKQMRDCYVPRFKISSNIDLEQPLKNMGFDNIFNEVESQWPGVTDNLYTYVSDVRQKIEIKVFEAGIDNGPASDSEDIKSEESIAIKRPFVYLIVQEKYNLIVFAGAYTDPAVYNL